MAVHDDQRDEDEPVHDDQRNEHRDRLVRGEDTVGDASARDDVRDDAPRGNPEDSSDHDQLAEDLATSEIAATQVAPEARSASDVQDELAGENGREVPATTSPSHSNASGGAYESSNGRGECTIIAMAKPQPDHDDAQGNAALTAPLRQAQSRNARSFL